MRVIAFEWDEQNELHIAKHHVTPYEVEEICKTARVIRKSRGGRYIFFGQTSVGRYLVVILEYKGRGLVRVITSREMDKAERQFYQRRH